MRQIDRGKIAKNIIAVVGLSCFMSAAMADDVHLKNGKILAGEVTEQTDIFLTIKLKVGEATIKMSDVESVEKKELPAGFFAEEKAPPEKKETAEAPKGAGGSEKGEKNKKEKPEKPQPPYNTVIEAKYSVENSKDVIDVKGTTRLPDKTSIYVFFKKAKNFLASREAPVKDNQFSVRLGPFEKQIAAGEYTIEADFTVYRQQEDIIRLIRAKEGVKTVDSFTVVFPLTVEKQGKAGISEGDVKEKMLSMISELGRLHDELEKTRIAHKGNFDRIAWNKWSDSWSLQIKKISTQLRDISQRSVPIFPQAQRNIDNAAQVLMHMRDAYAFELKNPEKAAEVAKNPNARAGPEFLNQVFLDSLKSANDEVNQINE